MPQANVLPKYEVELLEGTTMRRVAKKTEKGLEFEEIEVPKGYMVYFPRGASMRVPTLKRLEQLGLAAPAPIVDMDSGDEQPNPASLSLKSRVESLNLRNGRRPAHTAQ